MGLIVSIIIYGVIGMLGGYVALKFFKEKKRRKQNLNQEGLKEL